MLVMLADNGAMWQALQLEKHQGDLQQQGFPLAVASAYKQNASGFFDEGVSFISLGRGSQVQSAAWLAPTQISLSLSAA